MNNPETPCDMPRECGLDMKSTEGERKAYKNTEDNSTKCSEADIQQLRKETLGSPNQVSNKNSASNVGDAFFDSKSSYSEQSLRRVLNHLQEDSSDKSVRCNKDQKDIIGRVVSQIIQDEH